MATPTVLSDSELPKQDNPPIRYDAQKERHQEKAKTIVITGPDSPSWVFIMLLRTLVPALKENGKTKKGKLRRFRNT